MSEGGGGAQNSNMYVSGRYGSFGEVKRQANIPRTQQPDKVYQNLDKRDNYQPGRLYVFNEGKNNEIKIRDDSAGHYEKGRIPAHFNLQKGGTEEARKAHYVYKSDPPKCDWRQDPYWSKHPTYGKPDPKP